MAIESNIIFRIGSKVGPGGFASLKAGIDLIGQLSSKVQDAIKGLDEFTNIWKRTNKQAVLMADTAAQGLIDTAEVIKGYNKLVKSGAKVTEEQFRIMAVRAVELAKATGQVATKAFAKLTDGISRGSYRALAEYGIKLKDSTDLQKAQTEGIKALTDGFEDLKVKTETASERFYALDNNIGTFKALLWDTMGATGAFGEELDSVNGALGEMNTLLSLAPNAMADLMTSFDGVAGFAAEAALQVMKFVNGLSFLGELTGVSGALRDIAASPWESRRGDISRESQRTREESAAAAGGKGRTRRGAGGKGSGGPSFEMWQTTDAEQAWVDTMGSIEGFRDEPLARATQAAIPQHGAEERKRWLEQTLAEMMALEQEHSQQLREMQIETNDMEMARSVSHFESMLGIEQQYVDASNRTWNSGLQGKLGMARQFFGNIAALQTSESERLFNIGKAAAIGEAAVNTALGAIKAYQSMAGIPYVGPILGAIAAAAVTATGAISIATIKRQTFKGGGGVSSGSGSSGGAGGMSGGGMSGGGGFGGGGAPSYSSNQDKEPIEIVITMKDDAGTSMFEAMIAENEQADVDGRDGFYTRKVAA